MRREIQLFGYVLLCLYYRLDALHNVINMEDRYDAPATVRHYNLKVKAKSG